MNRRCACTCRSHNGFLTAKGLAEAAQRDVIIDGVASMDMFGYLDKSGSVSAMVEVEENHVWDDQLLDEQARRVLNGV